MGHINPFFEAAGFVRVGSSPHKDHCRVAHSAIYGGHRKHASPRLVSRETHEKSRFAAPVYYVFDNRPHARPRRHDGHS
jgi:hypothetical protein